MCGQIQGIYTRRWYIKGSYVSSRNYSSINSFKKQIQTLVRIYRQTINTWKELRSTIWRMNHHQQQQRKNTLATARRHCVFAVDSFYSSSRGARAHNVIARIIARAPASPRSTHSANKHLSRRASPRRQVRSTRGRLWYTYVSRRAAT